jgi:hypothetical protein
VDLSKLPRLSGADASSPLTAKVPAVPDSPAISPPIAPTQTTTVPARPVEDRLFGGELWISVIVALLLIGMSRHFPAYVFDQLTGRTFHTGVIFTSDNSEVPYPQVEGFAMLTDAAVFAFGAALLCDPILRILAAMTTGMARRGLMAISLCLMVSAVALNAFVAIKLLGANIMPLISGLAVAFGGYVAFEQWQTLRSLRH